MARLLYQSRKYHYNVVRALDVPAACFNPPSGGGFQFYGA